MLSKKTAKIFSFVMVAAVFAYTVTLSVTAVDDPSDVSEVTWQSDENFNGWQMHNLELNSTGNASAANSGVRLKKKADSTYETQGSMTYTFSPGARVDWVESQYDFIKTRNPRRYIFMPYWYYRDGQDNPVGKTGYFNGEPSRFFDSKYVAKFDTGDPVTGSGRGEVTDVFDVGCSGLTLTGGLEEEEAWVLNNAKNFGYYYYDNPAGTPRMLQYQHSLAEAREAGICTDINKVNSISHIKADGTVVTRKIIPGDGEWVSRNGSTLAVDDQNRVWVSQRGTNGKFYIYVIKGDVFDADETVDYSFDPIYLGSTRPYNFIFDKNFKHLFYTDSSNVLYSLDTATKEIKVKFDGKLNGQTISGTTTGITNDIYGNIWLTLSGIYSSNAADETVKENGKLVRVPYNSDNAGVTVFDLDSIAQQLPESVKANNQFYKSYIPESSYTNFSAINKSEWRQVTTKRQYDPAQVVLTPEGTIAFKNENWYEYFGWTYYDRYLANPKRNSWYRSPSLGPLGGIGYAKVTGNSGINPTISTLKDYSDGKYAGTLGFDINNNLWVPNEVGANIYAKSGDNYSLLGQYNMSDYGAIVDKAQETNNYKWLHENTNDPTLSSEISRIWTDTEGDFSGNNLENSLSDIKTYFSNKPISLTEDVDARLDIDVYSNAADERLNASDVIYMRVNLEGSGEGTPIFKWLKLKYQTEQETRVFIDKRVYKKTSDTESKESATFTNGDLAYISIRVNAQTEGEAQISKLTDAIPAEAKTISMVTNKSEREKFCQIPQSAATLTQDSPETSNQTNIWRGLSVSKDNKFICYKYFIDGGQNDNTKPSNNSVQIRTTAYGATVSNTDKLIGSSNNYMMIKYEPYIQSDEGANVEYQQKNDPNNRYLPMEDELSFSFTGSSYNFSGKTVDLSGINTYLYKRGIGARSRGGDLMALPVTLTDSKEENILAADNFYLLYNPAFYLFGNIFSGDNFAGKVFDFGSKNSATTRNLYSADDKQNTSSTAYEYEFDKGSVVYWDETQLDKNKRITDLISKYIPAPGKEIPPVVCEIQYSQFSDNPNSINLTNNDCILKNIQDPSKQLWPEGRVWYHKVQPDHQVISIGANEYDRPVKGNGTMVFDFSDAPDGTVLIKKLKFEEQNGSASKMGVIAINGGRVIFNEKATVFNGIVFAPGKTPSSAEDKGTIAFQGGSNAQAITIRGSLVSDKIEFNPRLKNGLGIKSRFSISIYNDASVLNAHLPIFDGIMDVVVK